MYCMRVEIFRTQDRNSLRHTVLYPGSFIPVKLRNMFLFQGCSFDAQLLKEMIEQREKIGQNCEKKRTKRGKKRDETGESCETLDRNT